ncbi:MAG: M1 family metallopeptidase [Chitinophagaceae bacterium]
MKKRLFSIVALTAMTSVWAHAQYAPHLAFDPLFYTSNGNALRSASGKPGANYWQNRADYKVVASFDTTSMVLTGKVTIDYTNNSSDDLDYLWLELSQNIDKQNSRSTLLSNDPEKKDIPDHNGFTIQSAQSEHNGKRNTLDYVVTDTRLQIRLDEPLKAHRSIRLTFEYNYPLLQSGGGDRSGYLDTKSGRIYEFSYWYPRMCVYDDIVGWNTMPFIGSGEMYMDYGDIDYTLTVPSGLLLVGSGALLNEKEVLDDAVLDKLQQARNSDATVMLHRKEDLKQSVTRKKEGTSTWHFKMDNTRDVAWAMSKAFIWDAAKINLPEGKTALAQSVYPMESIKGDSGWTNATAYLKASVEIFSKNWFPFPYPVATNVGGPIGGMEFPALAFDHWSAAGKDLWMLVSHEIGHSWYPMIVGSNERKNAWMDEGFNTFVDIYAQEEYANGRFAPKRDGEYAPKGGNPAEEIVPEIAKRLNGPTIMDAPDAMDGKDVHPLMYFKTAFGLVLLREVILGHDRFDYAFRQYTKEWAFRHPSPTDFFRAMNNGAGEDLSWFWNGWFYHNWQLDQAVQSVSYLQNNPSNGAQIKIANLQQLPMPVSADITETNGKVHHIDLPVDIWQRGAEWTFNVATTSAIQQVVLDPKNLLPDMDRSNNTWKGN